MVAIQAEEALVVVMVVAQMEVVRAVATEAALVAARAVSWAVQRAEEVRADPEVSTVVAGRVARKVAVAAKAAVVRGVVMVDSSTGYRQCKHVRTPAANAQCHFA